MKKDQEKMVKIMGKLKINVTLNLKHRDALRRRVLAAFDGTEPPWRRMKLPPHN